jgi:hypothetical protein
MDAGIVKTFREHNSLDQDTGKPLPGYVEHQFDGCQCDDCKAYRTESKKADAKE